MRPVRIAGSEPKPLGAPPDWDPEKHGDCGALFIRRESLNGVAFMRSAWEVETAEAMSLFAGAQLQIGVQGIEHPVLHMQVGQLPPDFDPTVNARRYTSTDGRTMARVEMLFPFGGGRRAFCNVQADGTFADAVSTGITACEALARKHGWIE